MLWKCVAPGQVDFSSSPNLSTTCPTSKQGISEELQDFHPLSSHTTSSDTFALPCFRRGRPTGLAFLVFFPHPSLAISLFLSTAASSVMRVAYPRAACTASLRRTGCLQGEIAWTAWAMGRTSRDLWRGIAWPAQGPMGVPAAYPQEQMTPRPRSTAWPPRPGYSSRTWGRARRGGSLLPGIWGTGITSKHMYLAFSPITSPLGGVCGSHGGPPFTLRSPRTPPWGIGGFL